MRPRRMQGVVGAAAAAVMLLTTACTAEDVFDDGETASGETSASSTPTQRAGGDVAVWRVARRAQLDDATTEFTANVSRLACNGGVTGEVLPPTIEAGEDTVTVTFAVAPQDLGAHTCESNNWVPHLVRLGEPLGDRMLVDGACSSGSDAASTVFCTRGGVRFLA